MAYHVPLNGVVHIVHRGSPLIVMEFLNHLSHDFVGVVGRVIFFIIVRR